MIFLRFFETNVLYLFSMRRIKEKEKDKTMMKQIDPEEMKALARQTDAGDAEIVYNDSIRELVKILARRAAVNGYEEFLSVVREKYGEDIDREQ